MEQTSIEKYLPLSEATYYIMLALIEPMHGYAIMRKVGLLSEQTVKLGPGTLYGVLSSLEKQGLIIMTGEEERRKYYRLTEVGREVLKKQFNRLELMAANGRLALQA